MRYLILVLFALPSCTGMVQREAYEEARKLPRVMQTAEVEKAWLGCFGIKNVADRLACVSSEGEKNRAQMNLYYINADRQWAADFWTVNKDGVIAEFLPKFKESVLPEKNPEILSVYIATVYYEDVIAESNAQRYAYNKATTFSNSVHNSVNQMNQAATQIRLNQLESRR
jgi:hypothetical protein